MPDFTACLYDTKGKLKLEYSLLYNTENGSYIDDITPSHQNVIIIQPNSETRIYLCRFLGITDGANYENCDEVLLLTSVGMNNYNYCHNITEEDILHSEKIKISK